MRQNRRKVVLLVHILKRFCLNCTGYHDEMRTLTMAKEMQVCNYMLHDCESSYKAAIKAAIPTAPNTPA